MKVATSKEIARLEALCYERGYDEEKFMLNAGRGVAELASQLIGNDPNLERVLILAGKGNNGGDAYVAGRVLLQKGIEVWSWSISESGESALCKKNREAFYASGGLSFTGASPFERGLIIDGLFGTGLNKAPKEPYASMISWANRSGCPILAVDIPSGLSGDTGEVYGEVIRATMTAALGLPKLGFFLQRGWDYVGKLKIVDFGLPKEVIDTFRTPYAFYERESCISALPPIRRGRHKYEAGAVFGFAGSPGMPGAANLAALASLKSGAGIVRLYHPRGMEAELSSSPYEVIKIAYSNENTDVLFEGLKHAGSAFFGPGIGRDEETGRLLKTLIQSISIPFVLDADALYFLSKDDFSFPAPAVLTPHLGEMNRLLQCRESSVSIKYLERCMDYARQKGAVLVLKGGPSFIISPEGSILINGTGDPGMATAGSGDVLTGVIAALMAEGLSPLDAASAGVCLHGWAGELAAKARSSYSMIASDIIEFLPQVFLKKGGY